MAQVRFCKNCGSVIGVEDSFCVSCGASIQQTATQGTLQKRSSREAANTASAVDGGLISQSKQAESGASPERKKEKWGIFRLFRRSVDNGEPVADSPIIERQERDSFDYDDPRYRTGLLDDDGYDDPLTTELGSDPVTYLTRKATGERIDFLVPVVIGKGKAATCRIAGNPAISRQHIRLFRMNNAFYVDDLGSTNGTRANDIRLVPGQPMVLHEGMSIELADETFVFHEERR